MTRSLAFALFLSTATATAAAAQSKETTEQMGTAEQRAACRHDVQRYCRAVKAEDGPYAYLYCLQKHRDDLRPACLKVISGGM
jgi:hypothetical protein